MIRRTPTMEIRDLQEQEALKDPGAVLVMVSVVLPELIEATQEVLRISDREHPAWDRAKEAIRRLTGAAATATRARAMQDGPGESRWACPKCGSHDVQVALPAWFREAPWFDLEYIEADASADVLFWSCGSCDESGSGEPVDLLHPYGLPADPGDRGDWEHERRKAKELDRRLDEEGSA